MSSKQHISKIVFLGCFFCMKKPSELYNSKNVETVVIWVFAIYSDLSMLPTFSNKSNKHYIRHYLIIFKLDFISFYSLCLFYLSDLESKVKSWSWNTLAILGCVVPTQCICHVDIAGTGSRNKNMFVSNWLC